MRLLAVALRLVVVALVREHPREVRVAERASGAVADPLELGDRPLVARDRRRELAARELGESEVDQAAADLLDVPDALGELEPSLERLDRVVEPPERREDVPEESSGAAQCPQVAVQPRSAPVPPCA